VPELSTQPQKMVAEPLVVLALSFCVHQYGWMALIYFRDKRLTTITPTLQFYAQGGISAELNPLTSQLHVM